MNGHVTSVFVGVILGWVGFALTGLIMPMPLAILAGIGVGVLSVTLLRQTVVITGFIALMGPVGVALPALALRHVASHLGLEIQAFSSAELVVFLLAYAAFLAASLGYLPVDIYRLGYAPLPVGIMALMLCAYGALTGNFFIPLVAVAGQGLWLKGWGSSNWFDHVLHAALMPIALLVLTAHIV
jgi:hypothetical protein